MFYAIIYELKNKTKDYTGLYEKIKTFGAWMHYIDHLWIIKSDKQATEISTELLPLIDKNKDYIIVIQIAKNYQGWLPKKAWDWLKERTF